MPVEMKAPRFLLRGFRRPSEVALLALGKLERQVLDQTWQRGEVSVRDIYLAFGENIAYTTLMTTLDRLFRKQLLDRRKDGRAFLYTAAVSREEFEHGIREDVIDRLLGGARKEFSRCWPVSLIRSVSAIVNCSTSWIVWSKRRSESCDERSISYVRAVGNVSGIGGALDY